jgi:hypothetical protein
MSRILPAKKILDIQGAGFASVQRTDALVYFRREARSAFLYVKGACGQSVPGRHPGRALKAITAAAGENAVAEDAPAR